MNVRLDREEDAEVDYSPHLDSFSTLKGRIARSGYTILPGLYLGDLKQVGHSSYTANGDGIFLLSVPGRNGRSHLF